MKRLFALIITAASLLFLSVVPAYTQSVHVPQNNAGAAYDNKPFAWQSGTTVNLYVDTTAFPEGSATYNAIVDGYTSARNSYSEYSVTYNVIPIAGCPVDPQGVYQTVTSSPMDPGDYGETTSELGSLDSAGIYVIVNSAATVFSTDILDSIPFLQGTAAHEASHDFGLGDCESCPADSTVMSYLSSPDDPGAIYPTSNDSNTADYTFYIGNVE